MAKTLFDPAQREYQVARLRALRPETPAAWGKLTAPDLLPHLADPIHVALGEREVPNTDQRFYKTRLGKWLVIYVVPKWPKAPPTAPEFDITQLGRRGTDFENDREELFEAIHRFAISSIPDHVPMHPVFGEISWKTWGYLMNKHIEHHCRQFGL
ncbi:MAG TPA: hypothetical protein VL651_16270 [Bacteroidia bacterium]|nr:hypothetical protein [Bacteroidia bacterium]